MNRYEVIQLENGTSAGVFDARHARHALEKLCADVGYATIEEAEKVLDAKIGEVFTVRLLPSSVEEALALLASSPDLDTLEGIIATLREWAQDETERDHYGRDAMRARDRLAAACDLRAERLYGV
jgi:hypothetical protein